MAEKNFAITPSVSISRSKFLRTNTHKTSFNLGDIVPLYVDEVLPGDTRSIDVASLIRMSTPIAPIMDDIEMELFAFFVPNRLVWSNWKKFMGESSSAGYAPWSGTFPYREWRPNNSSDATRSLGGYMGLGYFSNGTNSVRVSALPVRAYLLIYNRWFRDQNVEAPLTVNLGDGLDSSYAYEYAPLVAYKKSDYFTRALPYAQKGAPVTLPLGTTAKLITGANLYDVVGTGSDIKFGDTSGSPSSNLLGTVSDTFYGYNASGVSTGNKINRTNLLVDLSTATAATINQLREAFQLQKLLEKDALYGTR